MRFSDLSESEPMDGKLQLDFPSEKFAKSLSAFDPMLRPILTSSLSLSYPGIIPPLGLLAIIFQAGQEMTSEYYTLFLFER